MKRAISFPKDTIRWTKSFLNDFQRSITIEWGNATKIYFIRHFKTELNDGTFLGQARDPSIKRSNKAYLKPDSVSKLYSSPSKRTLETAKKLWKGIEVIEDNRLLEFDYGKAEGLSLDSFSEKYPEIILKWGKGKDTCFPNGESTRDVLERLLFFLNDLTVDIDNKKIGSIGVVTHNGVLRCLIGNTLGINKREWYKLVIPHGVPLEVMYWKKSLYLNIPRNLYSEIFYNFGQA